MAQQYGGMSTFGYHEMPTLETHGLDAVGLLSRGGLDEDHLLEARRAHEMHPTTRGGSVMHARGTSGLRSLIPEFFIYQGKDERADRNHR